MLFMLQIFYPVVVESVCSASLCLIPHFIAVFVRHNMCLVAQSFLGYFFSLPAFLTFNVKQKCQSLPGCVRFFIELAFSCMLNFFVAGFVAVVLIFSRSYITLSYRILSREFEGVSSRLWYYFREIMMLPIFACELSRFPLPNFIA